MEQQNRRRSTVPDQKSTYDGTPFALAFSRFLLHSESEEGDPASRKNKVAELCETTRLD
jgi:hypothetical protein